MGVCGAVWRPLKAQVRLEKQGSERCFRDPPEKGDSHRLWPPCASGWCGADEHDTTLIGGRRPPDLRIASSGAAARVSVHTHLALAPSRSPLARTPWWMTLPHRPGEVDGGAPVAVGVYGPDRFAASRHAREGARCVNGEINPPATFACNCARERQASRPRECDASVEKSAFRQVAVPRACSTLAWPCPARGIPNSRRMPTARDP